MRFKELKDQFVLFPKWHGKHPKIDFKKKKGKETYYALCYHRNSLREKMRLFSEFRWWSLEYKDGCKELAYLTFWGIFIRRGVIFRKLLDTWNVDNITPIQ